MEIYWIYLQKTA